MKCANSWRAIKSPIEWLDADAAERVPEVRRLLETFDGRTPKLPTVIFPEGERLEEPAPHDVAAKLGLRTRAGLEFYDVAIVGGGPAGLAAAVYGASEGLKTVMIEREAPGGQAGLSSRIENYLGFPSGLSGSVFARRAVDQARRFGVEIVSPQEASSIRTSDPYRFIRLSDGAELSCHALILAMGVQWRKLGIPGEDRLQGAGVYYGASSTEGISCRDEDVYLVGGANSAGQAAMYLCEICTPRRDAGARPFAGRHHVAIPYRSNRANRKYSRGTSLARSRSAWRRSSRNHHDRLRRFW